MQFKTKVTIHGAKPVDFKADDGRHYDYVLLYVEMPLDSSNGKNWGSSFETFKWQDNKNIEKLRQHKPGFEAEMLVEAVSNGKDTSLVCLDVYLPSVSQNVPKQI